MLPFPTELPYDAFKVVTQFVRGKVEKSNAANAVWNLAGYGLYLGLGPAELFPNNGLFTEISEVNNFIDAVEQNPENHDQLVQALPPFVVAALVRLAIKLLTK